MNGKQDKPAVAVASAAHCGYLKNAPANLYWLGTTYEVGSDRNSYTVKPPQIAKTGTSSNDLTPIGQISRGVIDINAYENDQFLGILPGYTAVQAREGYLQEHITTAEVNALIPGESTGVLRGWPVNQDETQASVMTVQEFPMTYVGKMTTGVDDGAVLDALVWAIKKDKDNAVCSFGDSGAQGVVEINGQPKLIGPESVFWSFVKLPGQVNPAEFNNSTDPSANLESMKRAFPDFDWSNTSAACGFNWTEPKLTKTFNIVPSSSLIPGEGGSSIGFLVHQAELQFANPNVPHTVVNGTVLVNFLDKGGGDDENAVLAINNPIISIAPDNSIMIGYYDAYQPGQINVLNAQGSDLTFYPSNPDTTLNSAIFSGPISYPSGATVESSKTVGVTLDNDEVVGEQVDPEPLANITPKYNLQIIDNQLNFIPVAGSTSTSTSSTTTTTVP
jgi:hypothetical protein